MTDVFKSQSGQDKFVCEIFEHVSDKSKLFYVDLAAYDGVFLSNTYALEKIGWNGLCIEPNQQAYVDMIANRTCLGKNVAVSDFSGFVPFKENGLIGQICDSKDVAKLKPCVTFDMAVNGRITVDYLSLDVEGHEFVILKSIFETTNIEIGVITVEHNLYNEGPEMKDKIFELLSKNGFTRVVDNAICDGILEYEDWYVNYGYMNKYYPK